MHPCSKWTNVESQKLIKSNDIINNTTCLKLKRFFVARPVRSMIYRKTAVTWRRIFLNERIVQILVDEKCFQMVGEICKADKGVLQETVEWSHDFDRMIGCVLFCCSRQTFKMSTSEVLDDQSKRTKIKWMCLVFCPEVFLLSLVKWSLVD